MANNTKYYWRVNAASSGGTSSWSETWEFTTIIAKPGLVVLQTPVNNFTYSCYDDPAKITLGWLSATNATSYNLQVSKNNIFDQLFIEKTGLTTLSQEITNIAYTKYYWRVRAIKPVELENGLKYGMLILFHLNPIHQH